MKKADPDWLPQVREFCRTAGITVMAWGPETLVVEAKSDQRAEEIAQQMRQLGFGVVPDDNDRDAGILTLTRKI